MQAKHVRTSATGWKPWPIPSAALKMNMLILFAIPIAAMAASPYTPAALLRIIVDMLASPCLARLGT